MRRRSLPGTRDELAPQGGRHPGVEIRRGVRDELLVLVDGRLADLDHPGTVSALRAAGLPIVRELCRALETGTAEARVEAAWLLGQIGSAAGIRALSRTIEGAGWRGEAPVVLQRATEALLRLGVPGIEAFDRAVGHLAPDDLTRLLLIRRASEQLVRIVPPPRLARWIIASWARALTVYSGHLQKLHRVSRADKLSFQRVVLEAYGLSLEQEHEAVPGLIDALNRYPAVSTQRGKRAS